MTDKQPEALRLADELESCGCLADEAIYDNAAAELRRLHRVDVSHGWWLDKTEWVQESSEASDLGKHRADVIKQRLDSMTAQRDELLQALKWCLEKGSRWHPCDPTVVAARSAIAKATGATQ